MARWIVGCAVVALLIPPALATAAATPNTRNQNVVCVAGDALASIEQDRRASDSRVVLRDSAGALVCFEMKAEQQKPAEEAEAEVAVAEFIEKKAQEVGVVTAPPPAAPTQPDAGPFGRIRRPPPVGRIRPPSPFQ